MAYDPKKDKVLKEWRVTIADGQVAIVALKSYEGGSPKLTIGPLEIEKPDGSVVFGRVRRWAWDELNELRDAITEALELIDDLAAKRKTA